LRRPHLPPRRYPHLGSTHGRVADAGVMQEELTGAHTEARATKADLEATTESLRRVSAELAEKTEQASSTQETLEADVSSLTSSLTSEQKLTDSLQKDLATASKSMETALARATVRGASSSSPQNLAHPFAPPAALNSTHCVRSCLRSQTPG